MMRLHGACLGEAAEQHTEGAQLAQVAQRVDAPLLGAPRQQVDVEGILG